MTINQTIIRTFLFSIILLFINLSSSYAGRIIKIDKNLTKKTVGLYMDYLEDRHNKLTINDVSNYKSDGLWQESKEENPSFGYTGTRYWVRLSFENVTDEDIQIYLEQEYTPMYYITLYIPEKDSFRSIETGHLKPFKQRTINTRTYTFPLTIKAGSRLTCYMLNSNEGSMSLFLNIWSPDTFRDVKDIENRILFIIYSIFFVMALSNFILFLFIRQIMYLYYVALIAFVALLFMSLDGFGYKFLWTGSPWWNYYNMPVNISLFIIFLNLFFLKMVDLVKYRELNKFYSNIYWLSIIMIPVAGLSAILFLFVPHYIAFQMIAIAVIINFILIAFIGSVLIIKERSRPALLVLSAGILPIVGAVIYILRFFGVTPSNIYTKWSHYLGFIFMLILFSIILADRINQMRKQVEKAEVKYRTLVEGSDDIVFSLDKNFEFISVNTAINKHLGFKEEDVIGKNILDFILYTWREKNEITREIIGDYLNSLIITRESVIFRTDFKTKYSHEPKEMQIKLEYVELEDKSEIILGKASVLIDDVILDFMKFEKHIYEANNFLNKTELLTQRLTRNLSKFIPKNELVGIRMSLQEILINAIEHGNLNIQFDEKTMAQSAGKYLKFIQDRQCDPRYEKKKVYVEYILNEKEVIYTITDEGKGFDHQNIEDFAQKAMEEFLSHGRGIVMAKEIFDEVRYNEKGNQVVLVKKFNTDKF